MTQLSFEFFSDVNAPHAYITVSMLQDGEAYDPTKFNPFMELAVEADNGLVLTVYEHGKDLSMTVEQWDEISRRARAYHAKVLASGDDW